MGALPSGKLRALSVLVSGWTISLVTAEPAQVLWKRAGSLFCMTDIHKDIFLDQGLIRAGGMCISAPSALHSGTLVLVSIRHW
jgi:hypothetical protein